MDNPFTRIDYFPGFALSKEEREELDQILEEFRRTGKIVIPGARQQEGGKVLSMSEHRQRKNAKRRGDDDKGSK